MKVLMITNHLFPAVCQELGLPSTVVVGWTYSGAEALLRSYSNIELGVASLYSGKVLKCMKINKINYFLLPTSRSNHQYDQKLEFYWKEIEDQFRPDVVHIYGTEYPHGLAYVQACSNKHVVVYIQGLVSVYEQYYYGGIDHKDLKNNVSIRDIVRRDSIFKQRQRMHKRGAFEKILIQNVDHIIGRTTWDKSHIWALNAGANYHFCNDTLRNEFYKHNWSYENCEKHSIFISQAQYPIKGLHQMIKALPIILNYFPDTIIYISGRNFVNPSKPWLLNGYGKYIQSLMKKEGVREKIIFTGILSESEICKRYLKANVSVSPSSIENCSNSLGEAQILGVPCVASYVGGTSNMVINEESGLLYRFEEIEMLAEAVCRIFNDPNLANKLSQYGKQAALKRYDQQKNANDLHNIYLKICNE